MKNKSFLTYFLIIIILVLLIFVIYDKFVKKEEVLKCPEKECEKCEVCDKEIKTEIGNELAISYNDEYAFLTFLNETESDDNKHTNIEKYEIPMENQKLNKAKIITDQIDKDVKEAVFLIFDDGTVNYAYKNSVGSSDSSEKVEVKTFEVLESIKVKDIESVKYDEEEKEIICDVVLEDGTKKTIKNKG